MLISSTRQCCNYGEGDLITVESTAFCNDEFFRMFCRHCGARWRWKDRKLQQIPELLPELKKAPL